MAKERPSIEELTRRCRTLNGMYRGTFWQHTASEGMYEVVSVGIRESDYAPIFHYSPVGNPDLIFDRVMTEWTAMVADGGELPRFQRMERIFDFRRVPQLRIPVNV